MKMVRPVKTFGMQEPSDFSYQYDSDRRPLIQTEPACLYKEENNLDDHSSIPQGVELKRKVVIENNVELSDFERKLQKIPQKSGKPSPGYRDARVADAYGGFR